MKRSLIPLLKRIAGLLVLILLLVFHVPVTTSLAVGPVYGITPSPTPEPTATAAPATATPIPTTVPPTSPPSKPDEPAHVIDVEFGCDLTCALAGTVPDIQGRVQLIHRGSGWIAEGIINNRTGTQFRVPYPGQWDVYLIEPPTGLSSPMTSPTDLPRFLGVVEADSGLQLVACPGSCPALPTPTPEAPSFLPETGDSPQVGNRLVSFAWLGLALILSVAPRFGRLLWARRRLKK
jgi:hypothetical protein